MGQDRSLWSKVLGPPGAALAVLLAICLVECASGSCLSYGHSCWGAHGKRSGQMSPQVYPKIPDWYLMKLLRSYSDLKQSTHVGPANRDSNAIYRVGQEVFPSTGKFGSAEMDDSPPIVTMDMRDKFEAIPMLDDNTITNAKLLQLMRDAADEK